MGLAVREGAGAGAHLDGPRAWLGLGTLTLTLNLTRLGCWGRTSTVLEPSANPNPNPNPNQVGLGRMGLGCWGRTSTVLEPSEASSLALRSDAPYGEESRASAGASPNEGSSLRPYRARIPSSAVRCTVSSARESSSFALLAGISAWLGLG